MSTPVLPAAEHALVVAIRRALMHIREGHAVEARRALEAGLAAAELLDAERETLDR